MNIAFRQRRDSGGNNSDNDGGNGGGKPDFAMAGAKDLTKIDEALAAVNTIVSEMVKE